MMNLDKYSYLKSTNSSFIDEVFKQYLADPGSVDETWRYFFEGVELSTVSQMADPTNTTEACREAYKEAGREACCREAYRRFGFTVADTNPLKAMSGVLPNHPELTSHGLSAEIIAKFRTTYCGRIGFEFAHISNREMRLFLKTEVEDVWPQKAVFSKEQKKRMLEKLTAAEAFEKFLHTRFVGKKRFSIEGGDGLIPLLDTMFDGAAKTGATDGVLGMAHRGRLNVLANIYGKKFEHIFAEFHGHLSVQAVAGSGDVKYHMGASTDYMTASGKQMHLSMASNPSHLEFVNPVIEGMVRAKQRRVVNGAEKAGVHAWQKVVPFLVHGDAAFAGQGVCYETLQLSQVPGYKTGGTIHVIVNNQVGFTTDPVDSRSTAFSSDVMKMLETPIFHVNGDDPEAICFAGIVAMKFRQKFNVDVMIDIICYRKYGHNEGDEPAFTQPLTYKFLKTHKTPRELYGEKLVVEGMLTANEVQEILDDMNARLQKSYEIGRLAEQQPSKIEKEGKAADGPVVSTLDFEKPSNTQVDVAVLKEIADKIYKMPEGFTPHPKLVKMLNDRLNQVITGKNIEWGTGEALAYGSLLLENIHVRMSGQDVERGTFTHRHAVLTDAVDGKKYNPFNFLRPGKQEVFELTNSILSETAVLGFEFGYSSSDPGSLVIWEAQFGDFANGAQVIIDQFIAASETKWQRMNAIVMLLPHGFEGQGAEHSSARLERFLQLCAENNIQVCNLTTPAQIFHALRRQVKRDFRKPLIVASPKKLLRLETARSTLDEFTKAGFQEVIDDPLKPKSPRKVVFCSGKVYYEAAEVAAVEMERSKKVTGKTSDVAIVRIEQLYPTPVSKIQAILKQYSTAKEVVWMQEEPKNQGAWFFMRDVIEPLVGSGQKFYYCGRPASAAPACGSEERHKLQQAKLIEEALK